MTASGTQSKTRRGRRIIERPRLIKLLDETDARTVLLLAPAGYGKTTLARQWAEKFNRALLVSLTPAHRDIAVLATELGALAGIGEDREQYIHSYVSARTNPQRAAAEIGRIVGSELSATSIQWVILDDYQEIADSPDAVGFVQAMHQHSGCRFLIASRVRPEWASPRMTVYGELAEISREVLAMNPSETRSVLGSRADLDELVRRTQGWPAAIALAGAAGLRGAGDWVLPTALHAFMTEELYESASEQLRTHLVRLALAPDLQESTLCQIFHERTSEIVSEAAERGFLSSAPDGAIELHPLIRDFLFERLATSRDGPELVTEAIQSAIDGRRWERAFHLILRFRRDEFVAPVLEQAYSELVKSGRIGTLASFVADLRAATSSPLPVVTDLVDAEIALRDGTFQLALRIADGVRVRLGESHPLVSRANAIIGQSEFMATHVSESEEAFRRAFNSARNADDSTDGLRGWALTAVQGERRYARSIVKKLSERRHDSSLDLIRCAIVELQWQRHQTGFPSKPPEIEEGLRVLDKVQDPRATSSFAYTAAASLALRADYSAANEMMEVLDAAIARYDLDFARPYSLHNHAHIALGQRRFGRAEQFLQRLEDAIAGRPLPYHRVNGQVLRARLALQTGQLDHALSLLPDELQVDVIPSMRGEYLATRAIALSLAGQRDKACATANEAQQITSAVEVLGLAAIALNAPFRESASVRALWDLSRRLGTWDVLLLGLRASDDLAGAVAAEQDLRPALAELYVRSNDRGLARRAGLRIRDTRKPEDLLTPRELEVLGLLAQGLRNQDISRALVISDSTTKVHIRHILEKLGVRTRAEAVARLGAIG